MALVKNVSPFGDLEVPSLGLTILAGETVDVPDEIAQSMLEQSFHWEAGNSTESTTTVSAPVAEEN